GHPSAVAGRRGPRALHRGPVLAAVAREPRADHGADRRARAARDLAARAVRPRCRDDRRAHPDRAGADGRPGQDDHGRHARRAAGRRPGRAPAVALRSPGADHRGHRGRRARRPRRPGRRRRGPRRRPAGAAAGPAGALRRRAAPARRRAPCGARALQPARPAPGAARL
ncbi:MAG: Transcriptional regulator, MarR family, partial [uncultured Thermoleophilia bacterium]